jgi:agmatine deiminase
MRSISEPIDSNPLSPSAAGFTMPPEWDPHDGCLMAWPVRRDLWGDALDAAKVEYAAVARAVARFEPVLMACPPGSAREAAGACGPGVEPLELPIDDSWARDSGPIVVRHRTDGRPAIVDFRFNAWGERWHPYADDDLLPTRIAAHLGLPVYRSPLVLEGGSFFVDGDGLLLTTEQCLLNPNRNPVLDRAGIEQRLRDDLGVERIAWIPYGHSTDVGPEGTDGHVDGVALFLGPGRVLLEVRGDPASREHERGIANLAALRAVRRPDGRPLEIATFDPGWDGPVSYLNLYLANGAAIVPVAGDERDRPALDRLAELLPDREIVAVPGRVLAFGGGGPHCITQQLPVGAWPAGRIRG